MPEARVPQQLRSALNASTIAVALPLFATYGIKHTLFVPVVFVVLFTAGLVSVVAVPIAIIVQSTILAVPSWRGSPCSIRSHLVALFIALLAEVSFVVSRVL